MYYMSIWNIVLIVLVSVSLGKLLMYLWMKPKETVPEIEVIIGQLKSGKFKWKLVRAGTQTTLAFQPGSGFTNRKDAVADANRKFGQFSDFKVLR